jgi:Peptidase inhibitor I78 family
MKDVQMMLKLIPVLGMAVTLAGCGGGGGGVPLAPQAPDREIADACGAAELQDMVGQSQDELARMKFAVPVRVITPGMAVTADYQANRLNFTIGEDGNIASITCT